MPFNYPISDTLDELFKQGHEALSSAGKAIDAPLQWPFGAEQVGPGPAEFISNMIMPKSEKEAMVGGVAGLAPAASWQETFSKVGSLANRFRNAVPDRKALEALEAMTENYPSITKAKLDIGQSSLSSHYTQNVRDVYSSNMFAEGLYPGKIVVNIPHMVEGGSIPNWMYPLERTPWLSYAHEGPLGHALTSGSLDIQHWLRTEAGVANPMKEHARAAIEGFAEGGSHGILNKYNKDVFAPYWGSYKGIQPLEDIYTTAGSMGVDVGDMTRRGSLPNQREVISNLLSIIKDRVARR